MAYFIISMGVILLVVLDVLDVRDVCVGEKRGWSDGEEKFEGEGTEEYWVLKKKWENLFPHFP